MPVESHPYIERGGPWESGYIERLQRPPLRGQIFYTSREAQLVIDAGLPGRN